MAVYAANPILRLMQRAKPTFKNMYALAYAITGNDGEAEYVLQRSITTLYKNGVTTGFQERFRGEVAANAIARARECAVKGDVEINYHCFDTSLDAPENDAVYARIQTESPENRRMLMLRYGCGLNVSGVAACVGADTKRVKRELDAMTKRLARYGDRERAEKRLTQACRAEIERVGAPPDLNAMMRSIELETSNTEVKRRLYPGRAIMFVVAVLMTLLLAAILWFSFVFLKYYRDFDKNESAAADTAYVITEPEGCEIEC